MASKEDEERQRQLEDAEDSTLIMQAGEGVGQEPAARGRAQAELMVRLRRSIDHLRVETATSSRRMVQLTWVLVVLTIIIATLTIVLLFKAS